MSMIKYNTAYFSELLMSSEIILLFQALDSVEVSEIHLTLFVYAGIWSFKL